MSGTLAVVVMIVLVTILLIQLCLVYTTACYDKVFRGSSDPAPLDDELSGQREARAWAQVASNMDPPGDENCVQSAAYQKARAREAAYGNWTQDFLKARMNSQFLATWTGQHSDGHAHTYAIKEPPDGYNHPLWMQATDCARDDKGSKIPSQPLYTRRITSTALQLACDHAFTGSYSKCFRRADPPEFHSCPCGYGLRNPKHLILHCPRHTRHRINAGIAGCYNPLTLTQLFSTKRGVAYLLDFLKMSSVAVADDSSLRQTWK